MQLGKIVGTVVSSHKDEKLEGLRFHVVKHVDSTGQPTGSFVIAVDAVGAGEGEMVLLASGSSARQTNITQGKPVDTVIMAIVDTIEVGHKRHYQKN